MVGKKFKTSILSAQMLSACQADDSEQVEAIDKEKDDKPAQANAETPSGSVTVVNEEPIKPEDLKIICKPSCSLRSTYLTTVNHVSFFLVKFQQATTCWADLAKS